MESINIAIAHRGAGLAPVFAAVEGGYFREQDLEPRLDYVPGHPRALEMLIAGQTDFFNTVGPELIVANGSHRGDAVFIASAISRSAQQVAARPGLTTREQLRGRRWGVPARSDADECSIVMAFERWNWDIATDAEIVVVGSGGPRLDLLLDERKVDVAIMHAPEPFQAIKRGWGSWRIRPPRRGFPEQLRCYHQPPHLRAARHGRALCARLIAAASIVSHGCRIRDWRFAQVYG